MLSPRLQRHQEKAFMNKKLRKYGLTMCALFTMICGALLSVQAATASTGPGGPPNPWVGIVMVEYYNNGIPSNVLTYVTVSGSTYLACRQKIADYMFQQFVYINGVKVRAYMFHGSVKCGYLAAEPVDPIDDVD
jgi:hypothetical protein